MKSVLMPHWPDLSTLTIDCLFTAVNACEQSPHDEDSAFAMACRVEMSNRLGGAVAMGAMMKDWGKA